MRKECKNDNRQIDIARVQGYHEGGSWGGEEYAYRGYKSNKLFTSDRFVRLDENFMRADGKPMRAYGLEIETECVGIDNCGVLAELYDKIIFAQYPDDLFKMQHDGSLGGDSSAECITQPMTREFVRNQYPAFKAMYNTYFPAFNISASRTGNCGMHVNISNGLFGRTKDAQDLAIRKLYYIVNHHFGLCCALFNRNVRNTHYCGKMDERVAKTMDLANMPCSHGVCFNLGHYSAGRVELRLVGGQSNFACFRNTMESVFFLVDAVKRLSWSDCDKPEKIFAGCNQYVYDRLKSKVKDAGAITAEQLAAILPTVIREELI